MWSFHGTCLAGLRVKERPTEPAADASSYGTSAGPACGNGRATGDVALPFPSRLTRSRLIDGFLKRALAMGATQVSKNIVTSRDGTREVLLRDPDTGAFVLFRGNRR